ncbi:terminase small subunit [Methylobacterium sp. J-030]|uniref:terminase small subunit n=1 Tax=Methylobacterium sp. J-030 TaxID=2836627 RepID=UPI001FBAC8A0|nr:terminase small subunit [Methylobacterium sp. J-030]MCJ2067766.1 terminase small subunit [Methylobacterium sp. J-030]
MSDLEKRGRIVNRSDLATLCNVTLPTIDAWVRKGCPVVERGSKGQQYQFDCAAVIDWRVASAVEDAVSGLQTGDGKVSKDEAVRRRAVASAIVAEVEADEALKSVVSRFDAETVVADFCQALRSALSNAGSKIAGRVVQMTQPNEVRDLCEAEINRAFQAAESDLQERWADVDGEGDRSGDLDED